MEKQAHCAPKHHIGFGVIVQSVRVDVETVVVRAMIYQWTLNMLILISNRESLLFLFLSNKNEWISIILFATITEFLLQPV